MPERILLLFCCLLAQLSALDGPTVEMWVDDAEVAVGDTVSVTVRYRWPLGWTLDADPRPGTVFNDAGAFLVDLPAPTRLRDGEAEQLTFTLGLVATTSGPWLLPRPGFQATAPDGSTGTAAAPAVVVTVGTETTDIDLGDASPLWLAADDPAAQPMPIWPWALVAVALAAIAVILLRRREPAVQLSPGERFAQDLRLLAGANDGKAASSLLSQALRRYLGATFACDALGATTRELRQLLAPHLEGDRRRSVMSIFDDLDAQRWAPDDIDPQSVLPIRERAEAWVQQDIAQRAAADDDTSNAA